MEEAGEQHPSLNEKGTGTSWANSDGRIPTPTTGRSPASLTKEERKELKRQVSEIQKRKRLWDARLKLWDHCEHDYGDMLLTFAEEYRKKHPNATLSEIDDIFIEIHGK